MTATEAAKIVRAMSESLTRQPDQFNIEIQMVGQSVVSHGGIGMNISATGGGPGSTTTGQNVSVSFGDVQIRQANEGFNSALATLVSKLEALAAELERSTPDEGRLRTAYRSLLDTWVPGVITSVVGNVLFAALHLAL